MGKDVRCENSYVKQHVGDALAQEPACYMLLRPKSLSFSLTHVCVTCLCGYAHMCGNLCGSQGFIRCLT